MTLRRSLSLAIALGAMSLSGRARAEGVAIDRLNAASAESSWFATDAASYHGHLRPAAGVVADYAHEPLASYGADGTLRSTIVRSSLVLHALGSVTLFERVRLAFAVPFSPWQDGDAGTFHGRRLSAPESGLGDLTLAADARLHGEADGPLRVAAGAKLALPTGSRSAYMGDGVVGVEPRLTVAGTLGRFEYAANGGVRLRPTVDLAGVDYGHEARLGAGAGVWLWERRLLVGPEVFAAVPLVGSGAGHPLEVALGAHARITRSVTVGLGGGLGVVNGLGSPDKRALLSVTWAAPLEPATVTPNEAPAIAAR